MHVVGQRRTYTWGVDTDYSAHLERLSRKTPKMADVMDSAREVMRKKNSPVVTFAEVGRHAGIASQGIYRYFHDAEDLYVLLVLDELDRLHTTVLESFSGVKFPMLSGRVWATYNAVHNAFPVLGITFRDLSNSMATFIEKSPPMERIHQQSKDEFIRAQQIGVVRPDIDVEKMMDSIGFVSVNTLLPFVFKGMHGTPEWQQMSYLQIAALMYPVPNFNDPEELAAYLARLGVKSP